MRVVQVLVSETTRSLVIQILEDEGIDYVVFDETSRPDTSGVVSIPLPTPAVEPVLEKLRDAGIDERTYTVIFEAQTIISDRFERLEEAYAEESERQGDRIAREELAARAKSLVSGRSTFMVLTVVSAVIATAGLLMDSPAVVVGSMVIAPLIGPAMSASIGTVLDDEELFRRGVQMQVLGVLLAVASAAVFAGLVQALNLVPPGLDPMLFDEVTERAAPNFLILAIAIGAGLAGIISLLTGLDEALVGVMIAVAILPPAAAVGVGIAFAIPALAIGAGVFVLVNMLSINLAALLVLWAEGYRPRGWFQADQARSVLIKHAAVLLVAILLLSAFLGGVTYDSYVAATTESAIESDVTAALAVMEPTPELVAIELHRTGIIPPLEPERVVITVAAPPEATVPGLAARLARSIDHEITIEVHYVTIDRAG